MQIAPVDHATHRDTCAAVVVPCSAHDVLCPWTGPRGILTAHAATCPYEQMRPGLSRLIRENADLRRDVDLLLGADGKPLGLENGTIPNAGITASSSHPGCETERCRLNATPSGGAHAWAALHNNNQQYLQVDLGKETLVTGVATQGRADCDQWVTRYKLSYSLDGMRWVQLGQEFDGNLDRNTVVRHRVGPFRCRHIRFHPIAFHAHTSMRAEVYGA